MKPREESLRHMRPVFLIRRLRPTDLLDNLGLEDLVPSGFSCVFIYNSMELVIWLLDMRCIWPYWKADVEQDIRPFQAHKCGQLLMSESHRIGAHALLCFLGLLFALLETFR